MFALSRHENRAVRRFCVHCGACLGACLPRVRRQLRTGRAVLRRVRRPASLPKTSATPDPHAQKHIVNHAKMGQSRCRREV
jgi:succinate dehydrogenase/fumarate reductase-like Fe-S protein